MDGIQTFVSYQICRGTDEPEYCYMVFSGRNTKGMKEFVLDRLFIKHAEHDLRFIQIIPLVLYPKNKIVYYHYKGKRFHTIVVDHPVSNVDEVDHVFSMLYHRHNKEHCSIIYINPMV